MEIEKINDRIEMDMQKNTLLTEKRYNTEKLLEELEMNKEFPQLKQRVELERQIMLGEYPKSNL